MKRSCPYCGNELEVKVLDIEENDNNDIEIYHLMFYCYRCSFSHEEELRSNTNYGIL